MFHFVFQARDVDVLTTAMDMDEALDGEIILIKDDYSVGPTANLFTEEGTALRAAWWRNVLNEPEPAEPAAPLSGDDIRLQEILNRMREMEFDQIWIWMASNAQDVSGYYWLISRLNEFAGRIYILSLNNLPFISDKGTVFYPAVLAEIPPREFIKAKKLARPVTLSEFETDPDEWAKLCRDNKNLRMLEGAKKLVQQEDSYFDALLKKWVTGEFQKTSRIIHQFLSKSPVKTGEAFLLWRLRELAAQGEIEQQGELLRIPQTASSAEISENP
jgi:hypothetical protein